MRKLSILMLMPCLAVSLVACVSAPKPSRPAPVPLPQGVSLTGSEIGYRGSIDAAGVAEVHALLRAHPHITSLAIESGGGDGDAAMQLGDLVLAHGLDVRATGDLCASSCANYVFTSGRNKTIDPGTLVFWHGSPLLMEMMRFTHIQTDADGNTTTVDYEGEALAEYWQQPEMVGKAHIARLQQEAWFARRGVDGAITIFGQQIGCECNWTFSVADMAAFGVGNVSANADYPQEQPWWARNHIRQLKLADHPAHAPESRQP